MRNIKNFKEFSLKGNVANNVFAGFGPVETSSSNGYTPGGVYYETTDGYNDANNDGQWQMGESTYSNTTYHQCGPDTIGIL